MNRMNYKTLQIKDINEIDQHKSIMFTRIRITVKLYVLLKKIILRARLQTLSREYQINYKIDDI